MIKALKTKRKKKRKENQKDDQTTDEDVKAVNSDELEEVVFIRQQDGKVKKVIVTTGIQDITYIEILSGLKEGDEIVTGPYNAISKTLKDGAKVKVVPKDKLF